MEFYEDKNIEYKRIDKLFGKKAVLSDIAEECVAFANAQGGWIIAGISDGKTEPPPYQKIDPDEMNKVVSRLRSLTDSVGFVNPEIITHENSGQFFKFRILPTSRTIATTTSGKVFIRITDKCMPVSGEDLTSLAAEKNAFQWELVPTKTSLNNADEKAKTEFLNPHLIQTFHDLDLMEGEGSGYDLVYEKLARDGKQLPIVESSITKVAVTVFSGIVDNEVLSILDYIDKHFQLTQKEYITLGIIATEHKILTTQLSDRLQLTSQDRIRTWMGSLQEKRIIITRGVKKGTEYLLNPELFASAKLGIIPTLKTIEPFKLEALIEEDLKYNGESKMSDVQNRIKEVPREDIQKAVYRMVERGNIIAFGGKRNRTYCLAKKK